MKRVKARIKRFEDIDPRHKCCNFASTNYRTHAEIEPEIEVDLSSITPMFLECHGCSELRLENQVRVLVGNENTWVSLDLLDLAEDE